MSQKYTSANTSIKTLPTVFKKIDFPVSSTVLDYGGGKYNKVKNFLWKKGIICNVFDPYNRPLEENQQAIQYGKSIGGYDYVVSANVLNVIYEDAIILDILNKMKHQAGPFGEIYVQVYSGSRDGVGSETTKGYQRNQKPPFYKPFIEKIFSEEYDITRKGKIYRMVSKKRTKIMKAGR